MIRKHCKERFLLVMILVLCGSGVAQAQLIADTSQVEMAEARQGESESICKQHRSRVNLCSSAPDRVSVTQMNDESFRK